MVPTVQQGATPPAGNFTDCYRFVWCIIINLCLGCVLLFNTGIFPILYFVWWRSIIVRARNYQAMCFCFSPQMSHGKRNLVANIFPMYFLILTFILKTFNIKLTFDYDYKRSLDKSLLFDLILLFLHHTSHFPIKNVTHRVNSQTVSTCFLCSISSKYWYFFIQLGSIWFYS